MSYRYRGIFAALAGLALLGAAPSPNQSGKPDQSHSTAAAQQSLQRIADAQAKQAEPGEYQAPCGDGEYNNKSDLCAQWYAARAARDAADWAYWAVFWSVVSLGLSSAGLIALVVTIRQGREGLRQARIANETSDRNARLQIQAYISLSSPAIEVLTDGRICISFDVANSGQSPARMVQITVEVFLRNGEERTRAFGRLLVLGDIRSGGNELAKAIGPKHGPLFAPIEERQPLSVIVDVAYETVFGDGTHTERIPYWASVGGGKEARISAPIRDGTQVSATIQHGHRPGGA